MTVEVAATLQAVAAEEWWSISRGRSLFSSRAHLLSVEDDPAVVTRYLLARDGRGRLVGGLPWYLWAGQGGTVIANYDPHRLFARRVMGAGVDRTPWFPLLLLGNRAGYTNELLLLSDLGPSRHRVLGRLVEQALELGAEAGARTVAAMYLGREAAAALGGLLPSSSPPLLTAADCFLPIAWDDFSGYLASLSGRRRKHARREINELRARGIRISAHRLRERHRICGELLANVQRRYGEEVEADEMISFLQRQAEALDDLSVVLIGQDDRGPLGFSLLYEWDGRLYGRAAGFDYERLEGAPLYFDLCVYTPIRLAISRRLREVRLGLESYPAKLMRGARLEPLWSVVVPPADVRVPWAAAIGGWNQGARAHWSQHVGHLAGGLPASEWTPPSLTLEAR